MRLKRIIFVFFIGLIGLNSIYYPITADLEREIDKSNDKTYNLSRISTEMGDFQTSDDKSDEISEFYGFKIIFPKNNRYFQSFPGLALNITNTTIIENNEYKSLIYSYKPDNSIEKTFDPENPDDWEIFTNDLESFWNQTEESVQINIDFKITVGDTNVPVYHSYIFKDLTPPNYYFGLNFDENGTLIPYNDSQDYYNQNPTIFFNITENIINNISIFLTVNTHIHQFSKLASINHLGDLINLTLPEWSEMDEGLNEIPIFLIDSAGNRASIKWLSIIKDISAPEFKSNHPNRYWLRIGMEDISNYENPIYKKYEIKENPIFNCQFADNDIKSVIMTVDLPYEKSEFVDFRHNSYFNENSQLNSHESHEISLYGVKVNHTNWVIEFPDFVWDKLQNQDIKMSIILDDFAGNNASHEFTVRHVSSLNRFLVITEDSKTFISLGLILYCIALTSFISFSLRSVKERYRPLEEDLKMIDPELLEVVIEQVDQTKLRNVVKFCKDLKDPAEYEKILPPDIQEFLKIPLQFLNLKEIHILLTRYKMDSMQLEEFVREMIALGPEERNQFILKYMENTSEDPGNLELDDKIDDLSLSDDFF